MARSLLDRLSRPTLWPITGGVHNGGGPRAWQEPRRAIKLLVGSVVAAYWSRRDRAGPYVSPVSLGLSDNVQRSMNLIMPLRYPISAGRGEVVAALTEATDEILVGLNNVGTVHFARFTIVDGNLCMFSVYDGDFQGYIRDFISAIGPAFDAVMTVVKDPPPTPCSQYVDEFIEWVHDRDAMQFPEEPTDVADDIGLLSRRTLSLLHRNRNVQVGFYRAYPGYTAAQIRDRMGVGW